MKIKNLIITGTILISTFSFAQKDELKTLKKIYSKEEISASDLENFKTTSAKLSTIANDEGDVVYANFYKSMLPQLELKVLGKGATPAQISGLFTASSIVNLANGINETLEYEKKSGKKVFTEDLVKQIQEMKPMLTNVAVGLGDAKKYKESAEVLYSLYKLDKKDVEKLYYAANYAVNGQDYENALKYYQELKSLNYSGEKTNYIATSKANNNEDYFDTKENRDKFVKLGTHAAPRDEKIPSKRGEIYKNYALILLQNGKDVEAKKAISEARTENPDDISLVLTEADLYYKLGDIETYKILVNRALEKNPNDADLLFNLGVVSANAKQVDEAEKYYRKAIALKPDYTNAYINLSELLLRADDKLFKELKKLGNTEKDNKRYEVLTAERKKIFTTIVPLLEKALEIDSKNEAAGKTLISMYKALEMTDKANALKAKMK